MGTSLADFRPIQPQAKHEQLASFLRDQVLSGALAPDTRLPTTQELSERWQVPIATVQAALAPLVKEGLLLRRPRLGTVVRGRTATLTRVGIYQPSTDGWQGGDRFAYRLAATLASRLEAAGVASSLLTDPRPAEARVDPWPDLVHAARTHQVDAVIAAETDFRSSPWLGRLPVPTAFYGSGQDVRDVWHDFADFAAQGLAGLRARGCRSVGLVSVTRAGTTYDDGSPHVESELPRTFLGSMAAHGLSTRPEWVRLPSREAGISEQDAEGFGYEQVRAMWAQADRPDGLLVYTDRVARGVVMGLLSLGIAAASAPRLVLHRNAELGLFCPLPADLLDSSVLTVADALLAAIEAQRNGRPLARTLLPYRLVRG